MSILMIPSQRLQVWDRDLQSSLRVQLHNRLVPDEDSLDYHCVLAAPEIRQIPQLQRPPEAGPMSFGLSMREITVRRLMPVGATRRFLTRRQKTKVTARWP